MLNSKMNGSDNCLFFLSGNIIYANDLFNGGGILFFDNGKSSKLIDDAVESFHVFGNHILYRDEDFAVYSYNILTHKCYKISDDGVKVLRYVSNDNFYFLLSEKRNGNRYVTVLTHDLSDGRKILESCDCYDINVYNDYLIYTCEDKDMKLHMDYC